MHVELESTYMSALFVGSERKTTCAEAAVPDSQARTRALPLQSNFPPVRVGLLCQKCPPRCGDNRNKFVCPAKYRMPERPFPQSGLYPSRCPQSVLRGRLPDFSEQPKPG